MYSKTLAAQPSLAPLPCCLQAKLTAGISYVIPTESRQHNVPGFPVLPHLTIRPPGLRELRDSAAADATLRTLRDARVAGACLPLRDENTMKRYLLRPGERADILAAAGGRVAEVGGAEGLEPLLADKSFVCLHYWMDPRTGAVHPCAAAAADAGSEAAAAGAEGRTRAYSIRESNLQVGVMVRKGVGGTCPLRAAARQLSRSGLLGALLDDPPPATSAQRARQQQQQQQQKQAQIPAPLAQIPQPWQQQQQQASPRSAPPQAVVAEGRSDSGGTSLASQFVDALVGAVEASDQRLKGGDAPPGLAMVAHNETHRRPEQSVTAVPETPTARQQAPAAPLSSGSGGGGGSSQDTSTGTATAAAEASVGADPGPASPESQGTVSAGTEAADGDAVSAAPARAQSCGEGGAAAAVSTLLGGAVVAEEEEGVDDLLMELGQQQG